mmetsp:Transcript_10122/g.19109  ORF Transcript_10122/g.19109 Transcript_10122/m.19109 type:complete len:447 (+) Transcript_10122:666-2006(+)|eukprot:CAMPEP_0114239718 /NCGR_PEP_ID=MMETSP0058-20121206/8628_1 /TAXON_ID=36894 /ORGANISM="Pyramimonas parkeae, CCMP726" /LENGTH=446 /DNA_ID=CAMNT_0001351955 /DNA_START=572 /DNA_END=1915 /DNA_ORIENTATION=+
MQATCYDTGAVRGGKVGPQARTLFATNPSTCSVGWRVRSLARVAFVPTNALYGKNTRRSVPAHHHAASWAAFIRRAAPQTPRSSCPQPSNNTPARPPLQCASHPARSEINVASLCPPEILEFGGRPGEEVSPLHEAGQEAELVSPEQLLRAAAALRVQSFFQPPTSDAAGALLFGECADSHYERWFLNKRKAEEQRSREMRLRGAQVVSLLAHLPAPLLQAHADCLLPRDRCAVATLDVFVGEALPGERLVGDKPGMAPRFLGFVDFARDGAGGAGEEGGGASALSARRAYATGAPGPGKMPLGLDPINPVNPSTELLKAISEETPSYDDSVDFLPPGIADQVGGNLPTLNRFGEGQRAYIFNLCVFSSARRQGIASMLLQRALQRCQQLGVRYVYIHVEAVNKGAQDLYERHGFVIEKEESDEVEQELGRAKRMLLYKDLGYSSN